MSQENNENRFTENESSFFENFKKNIKSDNNLLSPDNKTSSRHSKEKNIFQKTIGYIVAFFSVVAAFILSVYKRLSLLAKILIGSAALLLVAAIVLIIVISPKNKENSNKSKVPKENVKTVAEEYIKHIAVFDYDSVISTDLIRTKVVFEKIKSADFGAYIQSNKELQEADFGGSPDVKINGVKTNEIIESDQTFIKKFLSYFGTSVPAEELKTGKWVTVSYTLQGDSGFTVSNDTELFLINHTYNDKKTWQVIPKDYVDTYVSNNNINIQNGNDFAAFGDDYFN